MNIQHKCFAPLAIVARYVICCSLCVCASCSMEPKKSSAVDQQAEIKAKSNDFKAISTPQRKGGVMAKEKPKVGRLDARMQGFVAGASKELAAKLNISVDQIELVEASYVTWRDSGLGCPRRGMSYMQVLVDGTQIKLRGAGKIYHYHGGRNRKPSLCTTPALNEPLPSGSGDT